MLLKLRRLPHVLAYVEAQLSVFEWPPTERFMRQYQDLMHAWSRLSEVDDVAKRVFLAPSQGHFDWVRCPACFANFSSFTGIVELTL